MAALSMAVGANGHLGANVAEVKMLQGTGHVQIHYQLMVALTAQVLQLKLKHVKHFAQVSPTLLQWNINNLLVFIVVIDQISHGNLNHIASTLATSVLMNDNACETGYAQNWLGTIGCTNCYILFDMQVSTMITTVLLKQTIQFNYYDYGTINFDIHVGDTTTTMTLATQGTMVNPSSPVHIPCGEMPLQRFHVGQIARYLKFTATTYHLNGPGIKYIHFE